MRTWRLKPYVSSENTLVISSVEAQIEKYFVPCENTFIHVIPGSRLLRYDPQQREILQYYVESKLCSQLLFVGTRDPKFIDQIKSGNTIDHLQSTIKFNLSKLLNRAHGPVIDAETEIQMLIELNVIQQCKLLMDYFFIKERVEKNILQVKGLVTTLGNDQLKAIFKNGVEYNDTITLS